MFLHLSTDKMVTNNKNKLLNIYIFLIISELAFHLKGNKNQIILITNTSSNRHK